MILANVRSRLGSSDLRLVVIALSRGSAARRALYLRRLEVEGPDPLLDEPDLLDALLRIRSLAVPSPELFAYIAVRHALRASGIDDPTLSDYLAALVLAFGQHDRAYRLSDDAEAETYRYLADLVSELAAEMSAERAFLLQVHLGEYSLWLAGLFPDYVEARRVRRGGPDLPYYDALGRQGYRLAADHALARRHGVVQLYGTVAERFPALRNAFNRMSDRLLFPHAWTPGKLLRQL